MKIAIIALPSEEALVAPLPLGYIAAWLEQQRHIVRIHDLSLSRTDQHDWTDGLRAFRPHVIFVTGADRTKLTEVRRTIADIECVWLLLNVDMHGITPAEAAARAISLIDKDTVQDEHNVILNALFALRADLDTLPFPARHLLPIEQYRLTTAAGELQTNLFIGQMVDGRTLLRNPRMIVAEMRSISHESGIWHVLFEGLKITDDDAWMHDFLYGLIISKPGLRWEATASYKKLAPSLLKECQRAGCEAIRIEFDAMSVLDQQSERQILNQVVREARALGMGVHGNIILDPRYSSIPALVDMSATFELDRVTFSIRQAAQENTQPILDLANSHYRALQRRQFFVNRFGTYLGPMIWRISYSGLLGRNWQRLAFGEG